MTNIKSISIPNACLQSWQQMTAVNNGRHCAHCCKTVVDFTLMSNEDIINYLSAKTNVCGRIERYQLAHINNTLSARKLKAAWWKRAVVVLGLLGPAILKANAQSKHVIVNTQNNVRKAHGKDAHLLKAKSLNYIPQPNPIDTTQIKTHQIFPETTMTVTLGGLIAVPYVFDVFMFKKAWRRVKDKFGVRSQLAVDSNNMRSPYF